MISNPFIFQVLDISTCHIQKSEAMQLERDIPDNQVPAYELAEFGWLLYVGELDDNWPEERWSEALRNILKQAAELGCDYVRFDRDGREYDELPRFDW